MRERQAFMEKPRKMDKKDPQMRDTTKRKFYYERQVLNT